MSHGITMCSGAGCPLRADCYRFRGVVSGRWDAFGAAPYDPTTGTCAHFLDLATLGPTEQAIREKAYYRWVAAGRPEGPGDEHWRAAEDELEEAWQASLRPLPAEPAAG